MTDDVRTQFITQLETSTSSASLAQVELQYLGRNGIVNGLLKKMKDIPSEERKAYGASINTLKKDIEEKIKQKKQYILSQEEHTSAYDVTLPGTAMPKGSLHIVTLAIEEITHIFEKLGFIRMSYPEVEWEYFAFETLNMDKQHPARDDFETFFVDAPVDVKMGKMVLTPHTSSGQVREMMRLGKPPVRMINISKCYRPNWDTSHVPMFHQFEGLCIDRSITIANLKGTISYFAKEFFGENREIRLRPFHFQFTEPSFEVDITCGICNGTGSVNGQKCKLCKSGWLELGGTGMVHANVLKAGNIDPNIYSGWAFGFGVERVFMMKEGMNIDDLRIMYSGDIRFLEQF